MENTKQQKLGAGILTVSIIQLIFSAFGILGLAIMIFMKDVVESKLAAAGQPIPNQTQLFTSFIVIIAIIIGIILILCKKVLGIYIYFISVLANIAFSIIDSGIRYGTITVLVLPALMAFFLWKKKNIYGFGIKS